MDFFFLFCTLVTETRTSTKSSINNIKFRFTDIRTMRYGIKARGNGCHIYLLLCETVNGQMDPTVAWWMVGWLRCERDRMNENQTNNGSSNRNWATYSSFFRLKNISWCLEPLRQDKDDWRYACNNTNSIANHFWILSDRKRSNNKMQSRIRTNKAPQKWEKKGDIQSSPSARSQ